MGKLKSPGRVTRRRFLKSGLAAGAVLGLSGGYLLSGPAPPAYKPAPLPSQSRSGSTAPRLILISIDSLDPRYLYLNRRGEPGGKSGDWLLPNVRRFIEEGTWFENARCHMPAVTDPNHLNAVSGGSTAQSGLYSVSLQLFDWHADGRPNIVSPSLSFARDEEGRPVDTLFSAWKRRWPGSKTFYVSGKEWVARMFAAPGAGVDILIGGATVPSYGEPPPAGYRFYDPPGDEDAGNDFETGDQKSFSRVAYERNPRHFPPDMWIVNTALEMLDREQPDFGVVLLAQTDDLQHGLGAAWDPSEFSGEPGRKLSRINSMVAQEAVLDGLRDVDFHFGRMIAGLKEMPNYRDAILVLYSDHGHLTHRCRETIWDIFKKSAFGAGDRRVRTDLVEILAGAGVIRGAELDFRGFCPIMGSSVGGLHFQGDLARRLDKAARAKAALLAHRVIHPETGKPELPWDVLDQEDMRTGVAGVCGPGEMFHRHFGANDAPGRLHWPDVVVLARNHWQLPAVMGLLTNVGLALPKFLADRMAPWSAMLGGHGSADTQAVVLAMQGPEIVAGRRLSDPGGSADYRLADVAVTLAAMLGLELTSTTVGCDRTAELTRT